MNDKALLLHKLAVPLAVSLYKPGLVPSPEGVEEFQRLLSMLAYTSGWWAGSHSAMQASGAICFDAFRQARRPCRYRRRPPRSPPLSAVVSWGSARSQ